MKLDSCLIPFTRQCARQNLYSGVHLKHQQSTVTFNHNFIYAALFFHYQSTQCAFQNVNREGRSAGRFYAKEQFGSNKRHLHRPRIQFQVQLQDIQLITERGRWA